MCRSEARLGEETCPSCNGTSRNGWVHDLFWHAVDHPDFFVALCHIRSRVMQRYASAILHDTGLDATTLYTTKGSKIPLGPQHVEGDCAPTNVEPFLTPKRLATYAICTMLNAVLTTNCLLVIFLMFFFVDDTTNWNHLQRVNVYKVC